MQKVTEFLGGLVARFTSRKFLIAVGTIGIGVMTANYDLVEITVVSYLAAEGIPDVVTRYAGERSKQAAMNVRKAYVNATEGAYVPPEAKSDHLPPAVPNVAGGAVPGNYNGLK